MGYERFLPQFQARKNCSNQDQLQEANVPDEMDCERDPYPIPRVPFQRNLTEEVINLIKLSFINSVINEFIFQVRKDPAKFYSGPACSEKSPLPYSRLAILASQRQRFAALIKGTNLTQSHIEALDSKKLFILERLGRARTNGCLQANINKIDLSKIEG